MRLIDYILTAFKNIWRQKLRSFLTILAVVIGAISVVVMISLVVGAKSVFMDQLESMGALTMVSVVRSPDAEQNGNLFGGGGGGNGTDALILNDATVTSVKKISNITAVSPHTGAWQIASIKLEGLEKKYDPRLDAYEPNPAVDPQLLAGRNLNTNDEAKIVLSGDFLKRFGYTDNPSGVIGKNVIFITQGGYTGWGVNPEMPPQNQNGGDDKDWWDQQQKITHELKVEIVGVSVTGMGGGQNYIPLAWAKKLMVQKRWEYDKNKDKEREELRQQIEQRHKFDKIPWTQEELDAVNTQPTMTMIEESDFDRKGYDYITLKVNDTTQVEKVAEDVRKLGLGAVTAKDMLDQISNLFLILGLILGAIGGISLGVAAIGIINTMVMATYERTKEIGVMRACGASRSTVRMLFTFEAALLGFWGGLFGLAVSYGLIMLANHFGSQFIENQNINITTLITIPWWLVFSVIGFTTLIGLIAGLYPAIRASRKDPVEALRYE